MEYELRKLQLEFEITVRIKKESTGSSQRSERGGRKERKKRGERRLKMESVER